MFGNDQCLWDSRDLIWKLAFKLQLLLVPTTYLLPYSLNLNRFFIKANKLFVRTLDQLKTVKMMTMIIIIDLRCSNKILVLIVFSSCVGRSNTNDEFDKLEAARRIFFLVEGILKISR